jgi:DNA replication protein DnaC
MGDVTMEGMTSVMQSIIKRAEATQEHDRSDYTNQDDGLLYCGKCRTRKQMRLDVMGTEKIVPVVCRCKKAEMEAIRRREQQREDMEIVSKLRSKSLMDDKFSAQTFSSFEVSRQNEKVFRLCKRYADGFDQMLQRNQGLLLYGDVGTGKTFSSACIANALLDKKIPVVMTSFVKLLEKTRGFDEDDESIIRQLNKAKLLVIDDLGAERGSDYALEKVYDIVDSRYRANLPMILTTNLDLEEMKAERDIRRSRIYDRIFEVCYPVKFTGISFRKAEANKRFREMRDFLEGESG